MDVRLARPDDAEAIRAIYNVEVTTGTVVFDLVPRSPAAQLQWLADHSGAHPAVVAVENGEVLGFGSVSPYRSRPAYATTVEDSVYIDGHHRGKGVGKLVLAELVRLTTAHGVH